jgi:3-mercaptopropionate dioxygenase
MMSTQPLRSFIQAMTRAVEIDGANEERLLERGQAALSDLIADDHWLPEPFARASTEKYQQYLLWCDPFERFSVASFVWAPGQTTPVHDHTVWGMVGLLRGAERCEEYALDAAHLHKTGEHLVKTGDIDLVSPRIGDIHTVSNALTDQVSISIHVYGGNIGTIKRHVYEADGAMRDFVSGYASNVLPNLWA